MPVMSPHHKKISLLKIKDYIERRFGYVNMKQYEDRLVGTHIGNDFVITFSRDEVGINNRAQVLITSTRNKKVTIYKPQLMKDILIGIIN